MRPIPWILIAIALTALGIASTYEGQTTLSPPPGAPSLLHGRKMPVAAVEIPEIPGLGPAHGTPAVPTTVAVPDGLTLPVSPYGDGLRPSTSLVLVVTDGKDALMPLRVGLALLPDGEALAEVAPRDLATALGKLRADLATVNPHGTLTVCLVMDQRTQFEELIKPLLESCASAGLEQVLLGVRREKDAQVLAGVPYAFFPTEGQPTAAVLAPRQTIQLGGVFELKKPGRATFFRFGTGDAATNYQRARQHQDALKAHHSEAVEWEDEKYDDDGRAWTIRPTWNAGYGAIIEAGNTLRDIGISRFGLEFVPR